MIADAPQAAGESTHRRMYQTGERLSQIDVGLMKLCGHDLAIRATGIREVVPLPETLYADFSGTNACVGTIVIRGRAIPVLDIAGQLGFPPRKSMTGVVVVLRKGDILLGLVMDMVSGLARIAASQVQPLSIAGSSHQPIIANGFLHGQTLFGLIDEAMVFALPGIAHAVETSIAERHTTRLQGAVVLVSVANTNLAVDTSFVVATVPSDTLRPSPEPVSRWVGVVRYLDQEVPVIDDLAQFGLSGQASAGKGGAVLILRLGTSHMLGIKVDRIRRILPLGTGALQPFSPELRKRLSLFMGAVVDHEGLQSLMLDHDAVTQCDDLRMMAALTRSTGQTVSAIKADAPGGRGSDEAQAFVVFQTGQGHEAAPLASIKQIISYPPNATPVRCSGSALCGLASYNGAPLPLFELVSLPIDVCGPGAGRMILVVESDGDYNGLVVERLETIARTVPQQRPGSASSHFIHAYFSGRSRAVTVCSPAALVHQLAGYPA